jgi:hypothetical protein
LLATLGIGGLWLALVLFRLEPPLRAEPRALAAQETPA